MGNETVALSPNAAFVLGNGPSLGAIDLAALSPYRTIGMNAAYRHWERIGWRPTDYACLDLVVGLSHIEGIRTLIREGKGKPVDGVRPISHFLLRQNLIEALGKDAENDRVINFDALRLRKPLLQVDPITTGSHALLWASLEGANPIVLLGIDGNYVEIVDGAKRREGIVLEISEQKANPNYFFEDYQQPGDLYNEPNPRPNLHLDAWRCAAERIASKTRVVNGNPNSEVRSFPFADAAELIATGLTPPTATNKVSDNPARHGTGKRLAQQAFHIFRKEPLFLIGPGLAAVLATLLWSFGAHTLAIFVISQLVAAVLTLQLYFGTRRTAPQNNAGDIALLLEEFARQNRIRHKDDTRED
ncbi:MAG: hypothetical protein KDE63_03430 [Novosphingobium sp.]|nr:hypothetical protein [Novosphingobium sp.]